MPCLRNLQRKRRGAIPFFIVLAATLFSICIGSLIRADEADEIVPDRRALQQLTRQSRDQTRILRAAQRALDQGDLATTLEACRELLRQDYDEFVLEEPSGSLGGVRQAILELLAGSPPAVLREWQRLNDGPARQALQQALQSGSQAELHHVAAQFSLTEPALQALLTESLIELSRGNQSRAQVLQEQLNWYQQLEIGSHSQAAAIRKLQSDLRQRTSTVDSAQQTDFRLWQSVRLPSAEPAWHWNDSPWNYDRAAGILPWASSQKRRFLHLGRQQPIIVDGLLVTRTPSAVVCLDRTSGMLRWAFETESLASAWSYLFGERDRLSQELVPEEWLQLEYSRGAIFLLDGFGPDTDAPPELTRLINILPEHVGARRLIAVRIGGQSEILWMASAQSGNGDVSLVRPVSPHQITTKPFEDHRFVSAPLVHDDHLYTVTWKSERAWLNCLRVATGQLLWRQPLMSLSGSFDGSAMASIVCGVSDSTLVCLTSDGLIVGCSLLDGSIQWAQTVKMPDEPEHETWDLDQKPSTEIVRSGSAPSSGSLWLKIHNGRIYCGRPSCPRLFCLNADTGQYVWTTPSRVQIGFASGQFDRMPAELTSDYLIMLGDGHCRALHLRDGREAWALPVAAHSGQALFDSDHCILPLDDLRVINIQLQSGRVQSFYPIHSALTEATIAPDGAGFVAASAWNVTAWSETTKPSGGGTGSDDADEFLNSLARHRLVANSSESDIIVRAQAASEVDCLRRLAELTLTKHQRLLLAVLTPELPGHAEMLRKQLRSDPLQLVELLPGWRVRLWRLFSATLRCNGAHTFRDWSRHAVLSETPADEIILNPGLAGNFRDALAMVDHLILKNQLSQAELMLLRLLAAATQEESIEVHARLVQIRRPFLAPHRLPAASGGAVAAFIQEMSSPQIASPLVTTLRKERGFSGHTRVEAEFPDWYRLMIISRIAENEAGNRLLDVMTGGNRSLPDSSVVVIPDRVSHALHRDRPGLLVNADDIRFGVSSLIEPDAPYRLWQRRFDTITGPAAWAFGSGFLAAASHDGVVCVHPLTGNVLWTLDFRRSEELSHLRGQRLMARCSEDFILLFSSLGTGCVVLRAFDGAVVRQSGYEPGSRQPVLVGTRLCTLSKQNKLRITDLTTGKEIPSQAENESVVYLQELSVLSDNSLLLLNDNTEILIVDVSGGEVESRFRVKLTSNDTQNMRREPAVFRNQGSLLIGLSSKSRRTDRFANSELNEPHIAGGLLCCVDVATLQRRWQRSCHDSIAPPIYGDPSPLLILWSWKEQAAGIRRPPIFRREFSTRSLELTVLDALSGRQLARRDNLRLATPLRCLHDAKKQTIEITTDRSVIHVTYSR